MERYSRQNDTIKRTVCGTKVHPDAQWVYDNVRKEIPDISLGTVYRNLSRLCETGEIISLGTVNGRERFDGDLTPHTHFYCRECGKIYDLNVSLTEVSKQVAEKSGGSVLSANCMFEGICSHCLNNN